MKTLPVALTVIGCSVLLAIQAPAQTEAPEFAGVEKSMSPKAFEEAGLNKLTPEELARLNEFIRSYAASKSQEAANVAVEKAVKDNKVPSQPQIIQSRIIGRFTGYTGSSRFTLENGQVWQQSQGGSRAYPPVESPPVLVAKEFLGWRMYIAGGGNIRVHRMR